MVLEGFLDCRIDLLNYVLCEDEDDLALERPQQKPSLVPSEEGP